MRVTEVLRVYQKTLNPLFWSDEAIQFSSYDHVSIDEAIVSLQNPPVWSDEATQFLNYKHISINEAIVLLQNPPVLSDEAIMSLLKFVKRSVDRVGRSVSVSEDRSQYRRIGQSELRPPLHVGNPDRFMCTLEPSRIRSVFSLWCGFGYDFSL